MSKSVPAAIVRLLGGNVSGLDFHDPGSLDRVFADVLVLGPGFCKRYMGSSELQSYGARAVFRVPLGDPPKTTMFEGQALLDKARMLPLVHPELEGIFQRYRSGRIRNASPDETAIFYALIDFEIEHPVYVIEAEEGRLLVYLAGGTRLHWLEYLDAWRQAPVSSRTLDLLKKRFR